MSTSDGRLAGRGVLVTGAGRGIGRALAVRAAAEGARVVVNDLDHALAAEVAEEVGGHPEPGDCATDAGARHLVAAAGEHLGRVDVLLANAGVDVGGDLETPDEVWAQAHEVNVMAHVRLARAIVPTWTDTRGGAEPQQGGRFVVTASAAGLLGMIGNAPYTVTKHAAVAFAEWLSVTYGDRGVVVQAICPQGVRTRMLEQAGPLTALLSRDGALSPESVADAWVDSLADDRFLVLPHPEVAGYYAARAADTDGWLRGMRRLRTRVEEARA